MALTDYYLALNEDMFHVFKRGSVSKCMCVCVHVCVHVCVRVTLTLKRRPMIQQDDSKSRDAPCRSHPNS